LFQLAGPLCGEKSNSDALVASMPAVARVKGEPFYSDTPGSVVAGDADICGFASGRRFRSGPGTWRAMGLSA
jgi:hypothetical protein